jgi:putative ABC transport system substrate-binding protein
MRRREFIAGLGGSVVWPMVAGAQLGDRVRRIGVLMGLGENEPTTKSRLAAFRQGLSELGWAVGRNLQIDGRFAGADRALLPKYALELVSLKPDVFLAGSSASVVALQQATRTVPIVFAEATDPVGGGYVESLARPGGNATGFMGYEYGLAAKWLQLLKQIAPRVTRAAHLRRRPGHSSSCQSLRPFTATQRSKRPSSPLGTNRETASSSCRMCSRRCIAHRSYRRRPEIRYRRSIGHLILPETEACSPTEPTR